MLVLSPCMKIKMIFLMKRTSEKINILFLIYFEFSILKKNKNFTINILKLITNNYIYFKLIFKKIKENLFLI
jgi:hypothetical protein